MSDSCTDDDGETNAETESLHRVSQTNVQEEACNSGATNWQLPKIAELFQARTASDWVAQYPILKSLTDSAEEKLLSVQALLQWLESQRSNGVDVISAVQLNDFLLSRNVGIAAAARICCLLDVNGSANIHLTEAIAFAKTLSSTFLRNVGNIDFAVQTLNRSNLVVGVEDVHCLPDAVCRTKHSERIRHLLLASRLVSNDFVLPGSLGLHQRLTLARTLVWRDWCVKTSQRFCVNESSTGEQCGEPASCDADDTRSILPLDGSSESLLSSKLWQFEVSSNKSQAAILSDGNEKTYWQSDGASGSHWIIARCESKNILIDQIFLGVNADDSSYMPDKVVISADVSEELLETVREVHIPNSFSGEFQLLTSTLSRSYAFVMISIKTCHSNGIDCRVRSIRLACRRVNKPEVLLNIAELSATWFIGVLTAIVEACSSFSPSLSMTLSQQTKALFAQLPPLALTSTGAELYGSSTVNDFRLILSPNVQNSLQKFLDAFAADNFDGMLLKLQFALIRGDAGTAMHVASTIRESSHDVGEDSVIFVINSITTTLDLLFKELSSVCDLSVRWSNSTLPFSENPLLCSPAAPSSSAMPHVALQHQHLTFVLQGNCGGAFLPTEVTMTHPSSSFSTTSVCCSLFTADDESVASKAHAFSGFLDNILPDGLRQLQTVEVSSAGSGVRTLRISEPIICRFLILVFHPISADERCIEVLSLKVEGFPIARHLMKSFSGWPSILSAAALHTPEHIVMDIPIWVNFFLDVSLKIQFALTKSKQCLIDLNKLTADVILDLCTVLSVGAAEATSCDSYSKRKLSTLQLLYTIFQFKIGSKQSACCFLSPEQTDQLFSIIVSSSRSIDVAVARAANQIIIDCATVFFPDAKKRRSALLTLLKDSSMQFAQGSMDRASFVSLCTHYATNESLFLLPKFGQRPDSDAILSTMELLLSISLDHLQGNDAGTDAELDQSLADLLSAQQFHLFAWFQYVTDSFSTAENSEEKQGTAGLQPNECYALAQDLLLKYLQIVLRKLLVLLPLLHRIETEPSCGLCDTLNRFVSGIFHPACLWVLALDNRAIKLLVSGKTFLQTMAKRMSEDDVDLSTTFNRSGALKMLRTWEEESSHNPANALREVRETKFACFGATFFRVTFDEKCELAEDALEFVTSGCEKTTFSGKPGTVKWPSVFLKRSSSVKFSAKLRAGRSTWGYKFTVDALGCSEPPSILVMTDFYVSLVKVVGKLISIGLSDGLKSGGLSTKINRFASSELIELRNSPIFQMFFAGGSVNADANVIGDVLLNDFRQMSSIKEKLLRDPMQTLTWFRRHVFHAKQPRFPWFNNATEDFNACIIASFLAVVWHTEGLSEELRQLLFNDSDSNDLELSEPVPDVSDELTSAFDTAEAVATSLLRLKQQTAMRLEGDVDLTQHRFNAAVKQCLEKALLLLEFVPQSNQVLSQCQESGIPSLHQSNRHLSKETKKRTARISSSNRKSVSSESGFSVATPCSPLPSVHIANYRTKLLIAFILCVEPRADSIRAVAAAKAETLQFAAVGYKLSSALLATLCTDSVTGKVLKNCEVALVYLSELFAATEVSNKLRQIGDCRNSELVKEQSEFTEMLGAIAKTFLDMNPLSENCEALDKERVHSYVSNLNQRVLWSVFFLYAVTDNFDAILRQRPETAELFWQIIIDSGRLLNSPCLSFATLERFEYSANRLAQMDDVATHAKYVKEWLPACEEDFDGWYDLHSNCEDSERKMVKAFLAKYSELDAVNTPHVCRACSRSMGPPCYRCLECVDVEYCRQCFESGCCLGPKDEEHTAVHRCVKYDFYCDVCKGFVVGVRLNCTVCADYDECLCCHQSQQNSQVSIKDHNAEHAMQCILPTISFSSPAVVVTPLVCEFANTYAWLMFTQAALLFTNWSTAAKDDMSGVSYARIKEHVVRMISDSPGNAPLPITKRTESEVKHLRRLLGFVAIGLSTYEPSKLFPVLLQLVLLVPVSRQKAYLKIAHVVIKLVGKLAKRCGPLIADACTTEALPALHEDGLPAGNLTLLALGTVGANSIDFTLSKQKYNSVAHVVSLLYEESSWKAAVCAFLGASLHFVFTSADSYQCKCALFVYQIITEFPKLLCAGSAVTISAGAAGDDDTPNALTLLVDPGESDKNAIIDGKRFCRVLDIQSRIVRTVSANSLRASIFSVPTTDVIDEDHMSSFLSNLEDEAMQFVLTWPTIRATDSCSASSLSDLYLKLWLCSFMFRALLSLVKSNSAKEGSACHRFLSKPAFLRSLLQLAGTPTELFQSCSFAMLHLLAHRFIAPGLVSPEDLPYLTESINDNDEKEETERRSETQEVNLATDAILTIGSDTSRLHQRLSVLFYIMHSVAGSGSATESACEIAPETVAMAMTAILDDHGFTVPKVNLSGRKPNWNSIDLNAFPLDSGLQLHRLARSLPDRMLLSLTEDVLEATVDSVAFPDNDSFCRSIEKQLISESLCSEATNGGCAAVAFCYTNQLCIKLTAEQSSLLKQMKTVSDGSGVKFGSLPQFGGYLRVFHGSCVLAARHLLSAVLSHSSLPAAPTSYVDAFGFSEISELLSVAELFCATPGLQSNVAAVLSSMFANLLQSDAANFSQKDTELLHKLCLSSCQFLADSFCTKETVCLSVLKSSCDAVAVESKEVCSGRVCARIAGAMYLAIDIPELASGRVILATSAISGDGIVVEVTASDFAVGKSKLKQKHVVLNGDTVYLQFFQPPPGSETALELKINVQGFTVGRFEAGFQLLTLFLDKASCSLSFAIALPLPKLFLWAICIACQSNRVEILKIIGLLLKILSISLSVPQHAEKLRWTALAPFWDLQQSLEERLSKQPKQKCDRRSFVYRLQAALFELFYLAETVAKSVGLNSLGDLFLNQEAAVKAFKQGISVVLYLQAAMA